MASKHAMCSDLVNKERDVLVEDSLVLLVLLAKLLQEKVCGLVHLLHLWVCGVALHAQQRQHLAVCIEVAQQPLVVCAHLSVLVQAQRGHVVQHSAQHKGKTKGRQSGRE